MYRWFHTNRRMSRLKMLQLFSSCSAKELRRIESLMTEIRVPAGRVLTSRGEPGAEFFVVMSGAATVWREGVLLDTVGPGGYFGELALFDHGTRTATVIADTSMELFVVSPREFRSPHFLVRPVMERMLEVLSERLRRSDERWSSRLASRKLSDVERNASPRHWPTDEKNELANSALEDRHA